MKNVPLILGGKTISKAFKSLNLGNGSTWPGHIALKLNPRFIEDILKNSQTKIIMVAGTNGKTTTTRILRTILEENNHTLIHNESGANLLNGLASTILLKATPTGKIEAEYAIFEVDENALPHALLKITPDYLIILNLFRDQLDRYGEVETIAGKWQAALERLPSSTRVLLDADDPRVAYLGVNTQATVRYFGLEDGKKGSTKEYAADSLFCPRCGSKLMYRSKTYSHLGDWHCPKCKLGHPKAESVMIPYFPLSGTYNKYNTTASVLLAKQLRIPDEVIKQALESVSPAFGRQEKIAIQGKNVQLYLSKNPTGFNESLRTIVDQGAKHLLIVLNDRVADGHDVSWIWDVDFESFLHHFDTITASGDRCFDLALRIKYCDLPNTHYEIREGLEDAIQRSLAKLPQDQVLYVLPTYTAMLEVRKILKGRKIL